MSARIRNTVFFVAAGLVLVVAATVMPISTDRDGTTHVTTTYRGGGLGSVLAGIAVVSIALSLSTLTRPSRLRVRAQLALSCVTVVVAFVLVLSRIKDANNTFQFGPAHTSFALGSGVVLAAAAVIAALSFVRATGSSR